MRTEDLERLKSIAQWPKGWWELYPADHQAVAAAVEEIERLQKIVDSLPKCWTLVDGKLSQTRPIVPGMEVWWICNNHTWRGVVQGVTHDAVWIIPDDEEYWGTWSPDDCYDSREAAELARRETEIVNG